MQKGFYFNLSTLKLIIFLAIFLNAGNIYARPEVSDHQQKNISKLDASPKTEIKEVEQNDEKKDTPEQNTEKEEKEITGFKINDYVELSGAIEFELASIRDYGKKRHVTFSVATAELEFNIDLLDWLTAYIAIEYDPPTDRLFSLPGSNFHVDRTTFKEAYITFGGTEDYPYFLELGRMYLPFGMGDGAILGDTLTINDPLTIEIFEIRKEAVLFGKVWNGFRVAGYAFSRDDHFFHNHSDQYGATIGYSTPESDDFIFTTSLDYISSVFDTDGLRDSFPEALNESPAPGVSAHVRYLNHGISLIAELDSALKKTSFIQDDEHYDIQPMAWMLEAGYITHLYSKKAYTAVDFSESYGLQGEFSKRRLLGTVGVWLTDSLLLAFEYGHDIDYSTSDQGTGESTNTVTMQVAVEF